MDAYATPDDLANWLIDAPPDNAEQLLRSATLMVARAIGENPYGTITIDAARRDATAAQAASWVASDIDPAAGPASFTRAVVSKSIEGASISYSVPDATARAQALQDLAPDAYNILLAAGLLAVAMPVWTVPPDERLRLDEVGSPMTWPTYGLNL